MQRPDAAALLPTCDDLSPPSPKPASKDEERGSGPRVVSSHGPTTERQILAGRYELLALIGAGGMGNVYRARDLVLEELVALKVLRRELVTSPDALQRFHREVKLARRVTHPNVARMFDIGEHEGEKFLTMEFIEGSSLADMLERVGPMPVAKVMDIGVAICAGLRAAHRAGVIHRDLKPDNILISTNGRLKVADFGIARGLGLQGAGMMTLGAQIGTPAYMAPEQVEGGSIDERADIYAFGAMMYELLTGMHPWNGPTVVAIAVARLREPPPDPRIRRAELSPDLAAFVMKCMARRPEDRFAGAAELIVALESLDVTPRARGSLISLTGLEAELPPESVVPPTEANGASHAIALAGTMHGEVPAREHDTLRMEGHVPAPNANVKLAKSVAVLPFRNLGSAEDEHLAEGLTDELIDTLSMTRDLRVRPRGVVRRFKEVSDLRQIGVELGVQVIVDGTVRTVGDKLRVSVRLISVAEGYQIWAKRFDRPTGEFFSIANEAAASIQEALTVTSEAPERRAPTNPVALDLYLRGRHEHARFWGEGNVRAIDLLKRAHEQAPDEPMIMAGYAAALTRRFALQKGAESSADLARSLAERALALCPHLAEARLVLAALHLNHGRPAAATRELGIALSLSPTLADAQDMAGHMLIELGPIDEGIDRLRSAVTLEPRLMHTRWRIARAHALLGRWDQCYAMFDRIPEGDDARHLFWLTRARLAMWRGDPLTAARFEHEGGDAQLCVLSAAMCRLSRGGAGPNDPVFAALDAMQQESNPRRFAYLEQLRAEMLGRVGHHEGAIVAIERATAAGLVDVSWLDRCPLLDSLRGDPRFHAARHIVHERAQQALAALTSA